MSLPFDTQSLCVCYSGQALDVPPLFGPVTMLVQLAEFVKDDSGLSGAPGETGCYQCHGNEIIVDDTGHPTADTYPTSGIGNCLVCHTRHSFSIADARRPEACASCHLGPDHQDIEIYEASKHGQIYHSDGENWVWDQPPGEWEPGDYTAPTCATCHISGIGTLKLLTILRNDCTGTFGQRLQNLELILMSWVCTMATVKQGGNS